MSKSRGPLAAVHTRRCGSEGWWEEGEVEAGVERKMKMVDENMKAKLQTRTVPA